MSSNSSIAQNIDRIRQQIAAAASTVGRNPSEITLVAVTKTYPVDDIREALAAGITDTGENRIQEAVPKIAEIRADPATRQPRWHLIGHLQSNKAKAAVQNFDIIHSVHSVKLAKEIDRQAGQLNKLMQILIQVNISGEESKSGFAKSHVKNAIMEILDSTTNIKVIGFMTMAPFETAEDARPHFKALHELRDAISPEINNPNFDPRELSMGMSNDYLVAIEEGSTIVRVGSAIFGKRDY